MNNRNPSQQPLESRTNGAAAEEAIQMQVMPSAAIEAQERAQIDIQIATAKQWPRGKLSEIRDSIEELATLDDDTAIDCIYTLKRKGSTGEETIIQNGSVRLAEIAICCYKNIRVATQIIGNDGMRVTAQGACFDLENNIAISTTCDRPIASKDGRGGYKTWSLDMQIVTANAASAIAFRNAVFKVVPLALITPIVEKCKKIAAGEGPIQLRWQKAVKMFAPWGITQPMLLAWLDKPLDKPIDEIITDKEIVDLRGLFNGLRDGHNTVQETFAGIGKDGLPKSTNGGQAPHPAAATAKSSAEKQTQSVVASGDTLGPFDPGMFSDKEIDDLLTVGAQLHPPLTKARLIDQMGGANGVTKEQFIAKFAEKQK